MMSVKHLTMEELEAGMETILQTPKDHGEIKLIVRRPEIDQREILDEGHLDLVEGLIGDNWKARGVGQNAQRPANPDAQLTLMNARMIALLTQDEQSALERLSVFRSRLFADNLLWSLYSPVGISF